MWKEVQIYGLHENPYVSNSWDFISAKMIPSTSKTKLTKKIRSIEKDPQKMEFENIDVKEEPFEFEDYLSQEFTEHCANYCETRRRILL